MLEMLDLNGNFWFFTIYDFLIYDDDDLMIYEIFMIMIFSIVAFNIGFILFSFKCYKIFLREFSQPILFNEKDRL